MCTKLIFHVGLKEITVRSLYAYHNNTSKATKSSKGINLIPSERKTLPQENNSIILSPSVIADARKHQLENFKWATDKNKNEPKKAGKKHSIQILLSEGIKEYSPPSIYTVQYIILCITLKKQYCYYHRNTYILLKILQKDHFGYSTSF